ncbi:olfactory receptor 10AG1-like [Paroedura picta]|uniref:olfactory receptor 10AG1-like n=1 Tax=Paroedura picta TaxID=143630 RepID=UPI0040578EC1
MALEGETGTMNSTSWTEFVLLGFLSQTKIATLAFAIIFLMFVIALVGNSLLLLVIQLDSALQTPMYFFLSQLSFMDMCQVLVIVPQTTVSFVTQKKTITLFQCAAQVFFTLNIGTAECLLLAIMSYDRYVAICRPLQYAVLMRKIICLFMSAAAWVTTFSYALIKAIYLLFVSYCESNTMNHFFCEFSIVIKLSCSDTSLFERVSLFFGGNLFLLLPFSVIVLSYVSILLQVMKAKRVAERSHKALATCLPHLCVVTIFYGSGILRHIKPLPFYPGEQVQIFSALCTIATSTVNPFIYSLRNREVLSALGKLHSKLKVPK